MHPLAPVSANWFALVPAARNGTEWDCRRRRCNGQWPARHLDGYRPRWARRVRRQRRAEPFTQGAAVAIPLWLTSESGRRPVAARPDRRGARLAAAIQVADQPGCRAAHDGRLEQGRAAGLGARCGRSATAQPTTRRATRATTTASQDHPPRSLGCAGWAGTGQAWSRSVVRPDRRVCRTPRPVCCFRRAVLRCPAAWLLSWPPSSSAGCQGSPWTAQGRPGMRQQPHGVMAAAAVGRPLQAQEPLWLTLGARQRQCMGNSPGAASMSGSGTDVPPGAQAAAARFKLPHP